MITCPNCGAGIEQDAVKCPYCGYINITGAEKKYLDELDDIKDDLASIEDEPAKALKKGLSKGTRVIVFTIVTLLVLAAIYTVLLFAQTRDKPKMFLTAEDEAFASAYRITAGEELAEAYEEHNIEEMARIFDKAYSEDRVSLWGDPHYETAYAASCYMKLQECLKNNAGEKMTRREAEVITYYCFYFYYRAYGSDGRDIFDTIRDDEIIPIINNRLGFTAGDMERFRDDVTDPPNVVRSKTAIVARKYYKNYN